MNKKIAATCGIWVITISWLFRYYKTWAGVPVPGAWGVNVDYTRHAIVTTSPPYEIIQPLTRLATYPGGQNYDFAAYFFATINIITDSTEIVAALSTLNIIQVAGLILIPVTFLWWVDVSGKTPAWIWLLGLAIGMIPSAKTLIKTDAGQYTEPIATGFLLFLVVLIARKNGRRQELLLLFSYFIYVNLYHTWVFLGTVIIVSIAVVGRILKPSNSDTVPLVKLTTAVLIISIFFLTTFINHRFDEFITSSLGIVGFTGGFGGLSTQSEFAVTSTNDAFSFTSVRQSAKIISYILLLGLVGLFGLTHIKNFYYDRKLKIYDRTNRLLFSALCGFFIIIPVFVAWTGIIGAVNRIHYIGVYFSLFAGILLLRRGRRLRRISAAALVLLVVLALLVAGLTPGIQPTHNEQSYSAVEYTGTSVPEISFVFSDAQYAPPLLYYGVRGPTLVRQQSPNWEQRLEDVYYNGNPSSTVRGICATIDQQQIRPTGGDLPRYALAGSTENDPDVNTMSNRFQSPTRPIPDVLSETQRANRIYDNGEEGLFTVNCYHPVA